MNTGSNLGGKKDEMADAVRFTFMVYMLLSLERFLIEIKIYYTAFYCRIFHFIFITRTQNVVIT